MLTMQRGHSIVPGMLLRCLGFAQGLTVVKEMLGLVGIVQRKIFKYSAVLESEEAYQNKKEKGGKSGYGRKKIPGMLLLWSVCGVHRFQEV